MTPDERQDKIRGSLLGGAAGDALGYAVEFLSSGEIKRLYGENGITGYKTDGTGKALISDDTQMTLFTANGILVSDTMKRIPGNISTPEMYVPLALSDWLFTQQFSFASAPLSDTPSGYGRICWLLDVPELYERRAPGNTCLTALEAYGKELLDDYIGAKRNNSKGCGALMRIAPLGLHYDTDIKKLDKTGAQLSAVTHGHSLGYIPSAVLTHILNRLIFPVDGLCGLKNILTQAKETVAELFAGDAHIDDMNRLIDLAVSLSENGKSDAENIAALGEGWTAEETLAIALYCSLKYEHDFSSGIIAAVNHSGDSDSTGSVTGNILGAINGESALDKKWTDPLELADIIREIADDLYTGCKKSVGEVFTPEWECKYLRRHRKEYMDMLSFG